GRSANLRGADGHAFHGATYERLSKIAANGDDWAWALRLLRYRHSGGCVEHGDFTECRGLAHATASLRVVLRIGLPCIDRADTLSVIGGGGDVRLLLRLARTIFSRPALRYTVNHTSGVVYGEERTIVRGGTAHMGCESRRELFRAPSNELGT